MPFRIVLLTLVLFFSCTVSNDRCGKIIQKITANGNYYFVLQTDDYGSQINSDTYIPDDGIRQGLVNFATYEAYSVGDKYCAED